MSAGEVKLRRYYLPNEKGEGWGLFVIGSDGFFSVVSDYGNYAFRWSHPGCEFREFLTGLDADYTARKLSHGDPCVYQEDRTRNGVKRHIIERRRSGSLSREEASEEWERTRLLDDGLVGLFQWHQETKLDDAGEFAVYDLPADVRAFCARLLPRFQAVLRAELEATAPRPPSAPPDGSGR